MVLDRWKCDPQNAGYLEVGFPFFDPTKNLALAGSEFVDFFRSLRLSLFTLQLEYYVGQNARNNRELPSQIFGRCPHVANFWVGNAEVADIFLVWVDARGHRHNFKSFLFE